MTLFDFLRKNKFFYIEFFDMWDTPIFNGWITRIDLEQVIATCPQIGNMIVVEKPIIDGRYRRVTLMDYIDPSIESLLKGLYCF